MKDFIGGYCWRCANVDRPDGPERLALCDRHIGEEIRRCQTGFYAKQLLDRLGGGFPTTEEWR